jgi:F-type H+-transporting ATPase subunit b
VGNPIAIDLTLPAQMLAFLILVWILAKFAWKPLLNMMEKRRTGIEESLAQAQAEREQAERIKREYQAEMQKARQEAQEVIARATKVSEDRAAEILAAAREEAEKVKRSAIADIEREKEKALADVRTQIVDLSVSVAERIIRQKLDVNVEAQLVNQFIQEVGDLPC